MRRGELWTAAGGRHYAGKPRPVLVVQDDRFDATASITVCPLTSDPAEIPLLRIPLYPDNSNGLAEPSSIMLDKVTTMPRSKLDERIGKVSDTDMVALSRGLVVFLGLAGRMVSFLDIWDPHEPVHSPRNSLGRRVRYPSVTGESEFR